MRTCRQRISIAVHCSAVALLTPHHACAGTILSIGLLRKISYEWMETCLWQEQAPGMTLILFSGNVRDGQALLYEADQQQSICLKCVLTLPIALRVTSNSPSSEE